MRAGGGAVLTFGSLFSGVGGMDLGLERAGWRCAFQVELDDYCRRILAQHWPNVPRYGDIREVDWHGVPRVDLLAGGFPCQPISNAGKRRAQADDRWLWPEFARAICGVRPRYVLVENVEPLTRRGLGLVLGDLADLGFDAEWEVLSAESVGAPHLRRRLFIVAYPQSECGELRSAASGRPWGFAGSGPPLADADRKRREARALSAAQRAPLRHATGRGEAVRDPERPRLALGEIFRGDAAAELAATQRANGSAGGWWFSEPGLDRVVDGVADRVDRLRAIGNGVVPQVAEWIGRRLLEAI